jgi:AcrR family transcriptional regulator
LTDAKRQKILAAMLAVVGEQGYERASVQAVLDRADLYRQAFYDCFASKEDCFAAAYEEAAAAVEAEVRAAAGEGGWEQQLRGGLGRLLELLDDDPVLGRALLVEVHPAGGRPLARRQLALRRATAFLARGAREANGGDTPSLTPEATAAGIHSVLHARLASGRGGLRELCGELMYVAVLPYRGADAAAVAMARD